MEDDVCISVLSWHRVRPQLLHEEHLVREVGQGPCNYPILRIFQRVAQLDFATILLRCASEVTQGNAVINIVTSTHTAM